MNNFHSRFPQWIPILLRIRVELYNIVKCCCCCLGCRADVKMNHSKPQTEPDSLYGVLIFRLYVSLQVDLLNKH
jgi:hypothetical protein